MKTHLLQFKKVLLVAVFLAFSSMTAMAQHTVTGSVKDASTNKGLPGVNILVQGTTQGTSTDAKGHYELTAPSATDTLIFSFIGYQTRKVPIKGRSQINLTMQPQTISGKQMVVVGYGTQQKEDITGSISTVKSKNLKNTTSPMLGDALQGRVAGVSVQNSGTPGSAPKVKIRGPSTFGNNEPLYVVDGVPVGGIQDFDLNDIKSIQVLKDASAAAIYGTQAANGVVLITTKNGQKGKVRVSYNGYYGLENITQRYNMLNSRQYQKLDNEELRNANMPLAPANDPNSQYYVDPSSINTNWQDATFTTANTQNHSLTVSGGGENGSFAITGNYFNEGNTIKGPGPDYTRYSGRVNSDYTFGKFKVSEKMYYAHWDKTNLTGLHLTSPITDILHALPTQPIYSDTRLGGYSGTDSDIRKAISLNVIGANNLLESHTNTNRFLGAVTGQYNILDNLYYKVRFSYDHSLVSGKRFTPRYDLGFFYQNDIAKLDENRDKSTTQIVQNTLHYEQDFGSHHIKAFIGYTQQISEFNTIDGHAEGYSRPYFKVLSAGTENQTSTGTKNSHTLRSFLGRINYSYKDRYLVHGTLRRDGSSRFAPSNRYATFPSVSIGWRVSNEPFFADVDFINELKLRASYGRLGNQDIGNYAYSAYINSNANYVFGNQLANGATQINLVDPNIKWETNISRDIGIDMALFSNKFHVNADYYNNKAEDVLVGVPIPLSTGSNSNPTVNGASLRNKGFEFKLEYQDRSGELSYDLSANFSTLQNKVLSLGQGGKPIYGNGTKTAVGHSLGALYGYVANGIFQNWDEVYNHAYQNQKLDSNGNYDMGARDQTTAANFTAPGDIRFKDLNGDGKITSADRTYLGSAIPKYKYGFNADLQYNQWSLSMFFQGAYGNKIVNRVRQTVELMDGYGNYDQYVYDHHWTQKNHSNTVPRAIYGDPNDNGRDSKRWVEDGSYLRLKNIKLSYTLPEDLTNRIGIRNLLIYVQGQNVFTITKYKGYSPVISSVNASIDGPVGGGQSGLFSRAADVGSYPQPRTLSVGMSIDF
ncbi:MAG TPA: TonB-dependent receptor [Balneolaceae bacterium]|nr:TonB-dependent receptor [Balneolaceae bacterium]